MTTVEVLEKARRFVANGWCQGDYIKGDRLCLFGALNLAVGVQVDCDEKPSDFDNDLYRRLGAAAGVPYDELVWWNDAPERTQAEVVAAFDKAIQLARSAG